ncbi:MAG: SDR family NAD(P)-dependent oxidoreductase [Breznakibacter sp.]|nr:SDR family NAD(P)-dependent oxidoreductase [Breznakibacter sp.]
MGKIAMVTGATSGIGKATALMLARIGYDLVVTGRRQERLAELASIIGQQYGVKVFTMNFDIRDRQQTDAAFDQLPLEWQAIDLLVNNAGLAAGASGIEDGQWAHWEQMIDTNVKGLLYLSKKVIPFMVNRKAGHIVNLSSVAASQVYAGGNVYCATKHAVDAITKGMRVDLLKYGIRVSSVSPGMVETEFSIVRYDGDEQKAAKVYEGVTPLSADDVASTIEFIVTRPPHVNINDVLIMPTQQAMAYYVDRKV